MATYTVEINFLTHAEQERFGPSSVTSRHRGDGFMEALRRAVARLYGKRVWFNSSYAIPPLTGAWAWSIYGTAYKPVDGNSSTAVSGNLRIDVIRK